MKRDSNHYSWSLITSNRRLRFFNIYRHDENITVDEVTEAIKNEFERTGQLLGYCAMYHKIRQVHNLNAGLAEPVFMWCGINASVESKRQAKQVNEFQKIHFRIKFN